MHTIAHCVAIGFGLGLDLVFCRLVDMQRGAGTNLKVGAPGLRAHVRRSAGKCLLLCHFFGHFLVCCSSTHGAPRAQPFV